MITCNQIKKSRREIKMGVLFVVLIISSVAVAIGIKLYKEKYKISYGIIGLSIALFYAGVIYFVEKELGLDFGNVIDKIFIVAVSIISTLFITRSCDQSWKVGWWKKDDN